MSLPPPESSGIEPEAIPLDLLYEDDDLLVVNKPPGLLVHPGAGRSHGTVVNALLYHYPGISGIGGVERPGIVHRLDKDTTGLLVVAKSDRAHLALSLAFRQRKVAKTYLAVCYGEPTAADGVVDAPISRHPRERQEMAVVRSGRAARTLFHLEERFAGACLLSCRPVTGRTHQIRVHMAHVGHALVGDQVYAGRQWRNLPNGAAQAACRDFPRQALHAWRLTIPHPASGGLMTFEAPVPGDLAALLAALRAGAVRAG